MSRAVPGPRPPRRAEPPEALAPFELPPELAEKVERMTEEADREIAAGTVSFFWGEDHLVPVKRAAALIGVPWWEYVKQAAFRQAMADLAAARALDEAARPTPAAAPGPAPVPAPAGTSAGGSAEVRGR